MGFTGELVRDVLTFPLLEDATISLMDINPERLEWAKKGVEKLIAAGNRPAKVEASLDRAEALKDADGDQITSLAKPAAGGLSAENVMVFDSQGGLYVSDSFQGAISLLCGIVDAMNRRVFMSESHVGAVTLTGNIKQVPWEQVRLVTFHDYYGGFFKLHSPHHSIFMPVQIERPLRAIAIMEASVPPSALRVAKDGIALSRAVLER